MTMQSEAKALSKRIEAIKTKTTTLSVEIHQCAIDCVVHALKHGDITPAQQLCDAVRGPVRLGALKVWFIKRGPFTLDPKTRALQYAKKGVAELKAALEKDEAAFTENLKGETPWDLKGSEASDAKNFDLKAELTKVFRRAEKAKGKEGSKLYGIKNPKAMAEKIRKYEGESFEELWSRAITLKRMQYDDDTGPIQSQSLEEAQAAMH